MEVESGIAYLRKRFIQDAGFSASFLYAVLNEVYKEISSYTV